MASVIEMLQKLIAHEQSARTVGSIAEAEAFATRIQEILTKHKLSRTEVEAEHLEGDDPVGHSRIESKKVNNDEWFLILAQGVASNFYCRAIDESWKKQRGFRRDKAAVIFVGRESDRGAATSMFSYLDSLGLDLAERQRERLDRSETLSKFRAEMKARRVPLNSSEKHIGKLLNKCYDDFLLGFATALNIRLTKNRKLLETGASESAVALIRRDELAIEGVVSSLGGNTGTKEIGVKSPNFQNFFEVGYRAGSAVGLEARASLSSGS